MHGGGSAEGRTGPTNGRRELTIVVLTTAVFAGLALLAASRAWAVDASGGQPIGLVRDRTGGEFVPALPALAMVALAGSGALVASRGRARAAVSVLLMVAGLGIAAVVYAGRPVGNGTLWPALAMISGGMVAGMGLRALLCGRHYPSMGTRYERAARQEADGEADGDLWAAIDRGEDPTRD